MSDPESRERKSTDWADRETEESGDDTEPVYRDGTPKYECWHEDD